MCKTRSLAICKSRNIEHIDLMGKNKKDRKENIEGINRSY